jgi:hypothetical protein
MTTLSDAVFVAYPNVVTVSSGGTFASLLAHDVNGNVVVLNEATVQAYIDAHAYIAKRQAEYPPLTDLADALYHQSKGDETKLTAYLAKCESVKSKYPKPS